MKSVLAVTLVGGTAAVHPDRQAQVDFINSLPNITWKAAVNSRFAHAAPGESKSSNGVKARQEEALEDAMRRGTVKMQKPLLQGALPESFDAAEHWTDCADMINDIRDQSNCGCCWAFAGAEAASDRMCIATKAAIKLPLSAQDVCFCGSDDGCGGGGLQESWLHIKQEGAVTGGQYQTTDDTCSDWSFPHCHHHGPPGDDPYPPEGPGCPSQSSPQCPTKCDAGKSGEHSNFSDDKYSFRGDIIAAEGEHGIMQAIFHGGPVETGFTVYWDFEDYDGGIYQHVTGDEAGGHAVKIVGWGVENGVKYWKIANSWNPYWGESGFFRIVKGSNHCGIEDKIAASSPDATWGKVSDIGPYVPVCQDMGILDCSIASLLGCEDVAPLCLETCGCCVDSPPAFCTMPGPAPTPPTPPAPTPPAPTPPAPTPPAPTPPAPTPPAPTPPAPTPPAPSPTPTPSEGQCVLQNTEDDCNSIVEGGRPCRWCVLEYVGDGLCLEPDDTFDDCASVFYRRQQQKTAVV